MLIAQAMGPVLAAPMLDLMGPTVFLATMFLLATITLAVSSRLPTK
jgi:hypothetical protein